MGVIVHELLVGRSVDLRIGDEIHAIGVVRLVRKITELDPADVERIEALQDRQASRDVPTPGVVMVEGVSEFGPQGEWRGYLVLGWDAGRLLVQDLDWDHLPHLGWAVAAGDGTLVLHAEEGGAVHPIGSDEAVRRSILTQSGDLVEYALPVVARCRTVVTMPGGFYVATCDLTDGRRLRIVGESETGKPPSLEWFTGRSTAEVGKYRITDRLGRHQHRGGLVIGARAAG